MATETATRERRTFEWADLAVLAMLVALVVGVVAVAREWSGPLQPVAEIHLEVRCLPLYATFSLERSAGSPKPRMNANERECFRAVERILNLRSLAFIRGCPLFDPVRRMLRQSTSNEYIRARVENGGVIVRQIPLCEFQGDGVPLPGGEGRGEGERFI